MTAETQSGLWTLFMALQPQAGVNPQAMDDGERSHEDGENGREVAALEALAGCADSGYLNIVAGLDGRHPRDTCFVLCTW